MIKPKGSFHKKESIGLRLMLGIIQKILTAYPTPCQLLCLFTHSSRGYICFHRTKRSITTSSLSLELGLWYYRDVRWWWRLFIIGEILFRSLLPWRLCIHTFFLFSFPVGWDQLFLLEVILFSSLVSSLFLGSSPLTCFGPSVLILKLS